MAGLDKKKQLILIALGFTVYLLKFAFTVFPKTKVLESFFPYDPQLMTRPTYVDMAADCITYVLIFAVFAYVFPRYREILNMTAILFLGYLAEFILRYNNPVGYYIINDKWWGKIPIGYSTIALLIFLACFIVHLFLMLLTEEEYDDANN